MKASWLVSCRSVRSEMDGDTCCCCCWSAVGLHSGSQEQDENQSLLPPPPSLLHSVTSHLSSRLVSLPSAPSIFSCPPLAVCALPWLPVPPSAFLCRLEGPTVTGILNTALSSAQTLPPHLTVALRSHQGFFPFTQQPAIVAVSVGSRHLLGSWLFPNTFFFF